MDDATTGVGVVAISYVLGGLAISTALQQGCVLGIGYEGLCRVCGYVLLVSLSIGGTESSVARQV